LVWVSLHVTLVTWSLAKKDVSIWFSAVALVWVSSHLALVTWSLAKKDVSIWFSAVCWAWVGWHPAGALALDYLRST